MWPMLAMSLSVATLVALAVLALRVESSATQRLLTGVSSIVFGLIAFAAGFGDGRVQVAFIALMASAPLAITAWDAYYVGALQTNRRWAWRYTKLQLLLLPVILVALVLLTLSSGK